MSEKRDTLPQGWEWKKLEDITSKTKNKNPLSEPEKYFTYIDISSIDNCFFEIKEPKYLIGNEAPSRAKKEVEKGDILFATTRPNLKNIAMVEKDFENPIASTGFCILRGDKKIENKYLFYFLFTKNLSEQVESKIRGAQYPAIADKDLMNCTIPLPPLEEQRRIVGVLDRLFGKVDKSIALLDESIASASTLMPSALNEVFEELGEKWEKKFLNQVTINHDGKRIPIKEDKRIKNINGYPYYGASGIVDYVDDYIFDGEYLLISEDGANLVIRKTPIAFIASGKFWVNNHAHIVQAIQEITSNKYLEYFFAHVDISLYITGAAQPKLSQKKLFEIPIIIPPLDIQTQTVAYLDALHVKADALKKAQEKKKEALLALKASLLESAFKGEL
ncbi:restriction endonuclease subunit S [Sulfurospirillum cavolei]|uniref:restriction endonuclease subunit S n=1 Tax=Sulfurospirillum cavolei TaxID=366522 RepID=UPI003FA2E562